MNSQMSNWKFVVTIILVMAAMASVPAVYANPTSGAFSLLVPNVASNPSNGHLLTVTGAGTFDTLTLAATGGGSWEETTATGVFVNAGTWVATATTSFTSSASGGPNPGIQGGELKLKVVFTSVVTGTVRTDITSVAIDCSAGATPGTFTDGTTAGPFTVKVSGTTLFHLTS